MSIVDFISNKIKRKKYNQEWRKLNPNNNTSLSGLKRMERITVGNATYGPINVLDFNPNTGSSHIEIGNFCSIAQNVTFLLGGGHKMDSVSTYPFEHYIEGMEESADKGNIIIDDDVWIGYGVTILSGVHIGRGAVIGAQALVNKNVPPYAVVGGIPAKILKYRFSDLEIKELMKINYSNLSLNLVKNNIDLFTEKTNMENIKKIVKLSESPSPKKNNSWGNR